MCSRVRSDLLPDSVVHTNSVWPVSIHINVVSSRRDVRATAPKLAGYRPIASQGLRLKTHNPHGSTETPTKQHMCGDTGDRDRSSKGWVLRSGVTMRAPSTEFGVVSINGVDADTSYVEVGGETISPAELPSVPRFLPSGAGVLIQALEPGWHCRSAASCEQVIFS